MLAHGLPSRAILASLFLATRTDPPASRMRAQVLHFGNCQTLVVANHNDARAFKDLAEIVDQLFFLCSIHSFTPNLGVTPRLMFAGSANHPTFRVRYYGRAKRSRGEPHKSCLIPSQAGINGRTANPPSWTKQNSARRIARWLVSVPIDLKTPM